MNEVRGECSAFYGKCARREHTARPAPAGGPQGALLLFAAFLESPRRQRTRRAGVLSYLAAVIAPLIIVLNALRLLVIADAILSWVMPPDQAPRALTKAILDPAYAPIRSALRPLAGSLDLAPLVALVVLYAVQKWLEGRRAKDGAG